MEYYIVLSISNCVPLSAETTEDLRVQTRRDIRRTQGGFYDSRAPTAGAGWKRPITARHARTVPQPHTVPHLSPTLRHI